MANWFFEDGHFKSSTSKRSSKSFQQINLGLHLKSWRTTTSVWFAPTQPYLLVSTYFPTVWWPYYHVSEVPTAACETISSNISINIGVDSVVLQDLMSTAVPFSMTIFYPNLIRTFFHHVHSSLFFFFSLSGSFVHLCACTFSTYSLSDLLETLWNGWQQKFPVPSNTPISLLELQHTVQCLYGCSFSLKITSNIMRRFAFFLVGG